MKLWQFYFHKYLKIYAVNKRASVKSYPFSFISKLDIVYMVNYKDLSSCENYLLQTKLNIQCVVVL